MGITYRFDCGCEFPVLELSDDPAVLPLLHFDSRVIPESCPAVWDLLGRGLTKGVFQLESGLGRQWTKKLKPESLEHMGALGALLRPGPLCAVDDEGVSMTEHYVRRKNNQEEAVSFHASLDSILGKTYNVLTYQEQMMFIGRDLAGFDLVGVDKLRKAVGKKDQVALAKVRDEFYAGCTRVGVVTDEQAKTIWGWIQAAGRYAFNAAHAMSYGIRGYKTAFIKSHFPLAYFTSWLRHADKKPDVRQEVMELVNDMRLFDVPVCGPDLRTLEARINTDRRKAYFGLADIKGVGEAQVDKLLAAVPAVEKNLGKPVADWSWWEFLTQASGRISCNVVTRFIQAGALRHMAGSRSRMLAEYDAWSALTDKEQAWVRAAEYVSRDYFDPAAARLRLAVTEDEGEKLFLHLCLDLRQNNPGLARVTDLVSGLYALARPAYRRPQEKRWRTAKPGQEAEFDALEAEFDALEARLGEADDAEDRAAAKDAVKENRKGFRRVTTLHKEMEPEPAGPFGGCANKAREASVVGLASLLANPPSPLVDTPHWVAWSEEHLLGISLSCAKIDACDITAVNASCKDFASGRAGYMIFGVEVQAVRETRTKKGKSAGSRMAFLTVSDGSCALTDVICFPDAWKEFSHLLTEGNTVIIHGERDDRNKDSTGLIVKKVWQANQSLT